ncbi:tyrosine-type recombinase/integrase [Aquitalea magnusonii]|uniref:tyrosine-type recombinase/integrase n=1 Tax=Aquitalea magnusonii TaxID=332411 RepID=UPI001314F853|nr:integrase family protein [Aquitalea magnusonii]
MNKKNIDQIEYPAGSQVLYRDTELQGFALRVTKGSKVFVVESRVHGKTTRTTIGRYGTYTPDQARDLARSVLGKMAQGINPNQQKREVARKAVTLDQAYQGYIQERTLRPNSLRDYAKAMNRVFNDWRDIPLGSITRLMVEDRFDAISKPTLDKDGSVISKNEAFANQAFRFLRAVLNWASEKYANNDGEPLLHSNPCDRLKARQMWHRIERRDNWIRPDQLSVFFTGLQHQPQHTERQKMVRDMCVLYLLTGLRLQEAAKLQWTEVNLKRKTITIKAEHAKNHRKHELPIGNWLTSILQHHFEHRNTLPIESQSNYVFPGKDKDNHIGRFDAAIEVICKEICIDFTVHDLRRTFITIANNCVKGLSVYTIKRLINHSIDSSDVTAGYIIQDTESLREPMQQIEDFILAAAGVIEEKNK